MNTAHEDWFSPTGAGSGQGYNAAPNTKRGYGRDGGHLHTDAAYVLGALETGERQRFERHLPECAACRAAVHELVWVTRLLARAGPDGLVAVQEDASVDPPPV